MKKLTIIAVFLLGTTKLFSQGHNSLEQTKEQSISTMKQKHFRAYETVVVCDSAITENQMNKLTDLFISKDGFITYLMNLDSKTFTIFHIEYVNSGIIHSLFTRSGIESKIQSTNISTKFVYN